MSDKELLYWIVANVLNESQLSIIPPDRSMALRYLVARDKVSTK